MENKFTQFTLQCLQIYNKQQRYAATAHIDAAGYRFVSVLLFSFHLLGNFLAFMQLCTYIANALNLVRGYFFFSFFWLRCGGSISIDAFAADFRAFRSDRLRWRKLLTEIWVCIFRFSYEHREIFQWNRFAISHKNYFKACERLVNKSRNDSTKMLAKNRGKQKITLEKCNRPNAECINCFGSINISI